MLLAPVADAAISVSGISDKTKYDNSVTFTITADPDAVATTATLDGTPVAVGSAVTVSTVQFHELMVESRDAGHALVDSVTVRFVVRDSSRAGSEDGLPTFTPLRTVDDAPSAFAGGALKVIAPSAWPAGRPVPLAVLLHDSAGDPLWLSGKVSCGGFPSNIIQLRRGWGSALMPAATAAGPIQVNAGVAGLSHNPTITIEEAPVFTDVSGALSADATWPANSRIRVTGTLTVQAGATLTIEQGSLVMVDTGNGTTGSAAELVVHGALHISGTETNPVVIAPATAGGRWGGIELPSATSELTAGHTIFTGAGEDQNWFGTRSGYSTHKKQQALFLVSGSGSGTTVGAQLHLTNCYCFDLAGQAMNSRTNTRIDINRTLMQRAVTCGQLNGSKLTIDHSALIEFPGEDAAFVDADNDAIYLTNGDLAISNTVLGFTKDDGVDSGGNGGDNPFTAGADVTPLVFTNNWFEGIFHEANSLSGTRNVTHTGSVFLNCGQGVEAGYSNGSSGDGPNALLDGCLFTGNMVAARWGDNYGSGYSYNASMEVTNSLLLHSLYRDTFSYQWNPTAANAWIYQTSAVNTFGRPYYNLHGNHLSQPDPVHHPAESTWNPATDAHLLEPFMPVPGSAVGVAISSYEPPQPDTAAFPGSFTVRLSTFSSKPVSVNWSVIGKTAPGSGPETQLAGGLLEFLPGEIRKTITPVVSDPGSHGVIRVALSQPVNAEVTGEAWYFKTPAAANPSLVARGSSAWRYRETRSEPPADWKTLEFDDNSPSATEWLPCTLPAGFSVSGVTYGTTATRGPSNDITTTFYFRRKFIVTDPAQVTALTFKVRRDDGIVMWLNNEPTATVVSTDGTFNPPYTYASLAPNATNTGTWFSFDIPTSKLVAGENILAVELHQSSLNSSDLLLDCELLATWQSPLHLQMDTIGGQTVLYWQDPAAHAEQSTDLQSWQPLPGARSPLPIRSNNTNGFFRLKLP